MERRVYSRLVGLVTCLTTLSFFSVLVTDLNFYLDKMKQLLAMVLTGTHISEGSLN